MDGIQNIQELLSERDARLSLNSTKTTACFAVRAYAEPLANARPLAPSSPPTRIAFYACQMLRSLATASDEDLWATFGDVISKWEGVGIEKVWTDKFRNDLGSTAMAEMMMKVRTALATIQLEYVPPSSVSDFASYTASNEEDIQHAVAMHYRSTHDVDTIFFLPFLVRVDLLLASGIMSPETGSSPGRDVDALIVSTAKATLHEARHLVGTLIHGTSYHTSPMVQGAFPVPSECAEQNPETLQGEAGDYYEVTRYGALIMPTLVSPTDHFSPTTSRLCLTGRVGNSLLLELLSPIVDQVAQQVRDGAFVIPTGFFLVEHTYAVTGYVVELDDEELATSTDSPSAAPVHSAVQSASRHSSAARRSGPHTLPPGRRLGIPATDPRAAGYRNFRGVAHESGRGTIS